MNLNKNISVWRGNNTPPSQYHLWQKGDVLLHHNGLEWVENKVPMASPSQNGLMSKEDKDKLDELADEQVVADEEDITSVNGQLKLKDRDTTNGMGYIILRHPNNGILTQDMINRANTIYEIRYNFDLNSATITIPENCTLKFEGGKLSNGTLTGNGTMCSGSLLNIFNKVQLAGKFSNLSCNLVWWGAKEGEGVNNSESISYAMNSSIPIIEVSGRYYMSTPVSLPYNKIIKGRSGYNNKTTGFYANNDFSPISVDFPERYGVKPYTKTVYGMFYHRDTTRSEMHDIFIDAKHKADFCIEHIDLYGSIDLYTCYISNANVVGVLQYACEQPVFNEVMIKGCNIGLYISGNELNRDNIFDFSGIKKGAPNIGYFSSVRAIGNNYGMILSGMSDAALYKCEGGDNSIVGLYINNTKAVYIDSYYTEADGICNSWITKNGKEEVSKGTALEYLVNNNLDGFTCAKLSIYKSNVYYRAPIVFNNSSVKISSAFISIKPRSADETDVTTVQAPYESRNSGGVDALIIVKNSTLKAENIYQYRLSNDIGKRVLYDVIEMPEYIYSSPDKIDISCVNYDAKVFVAYPSQAGHLVANNYSTFINNGRSYDFNSKLMRLKEDGTISDFRINQFVDKIYDFPLYRLNKDLSIWVFDISLTKDQVNSIFDGQEQVLAVKYFKVLKETIARPIIRTEFYDQQNSLITSIQSSVADNKVLSPGTYMIQMPIYLILPKNNNNYSKIIIRHYNSTLGEVSPNNDDILYSDLYFYNIGQKILTGNNIRETVERGNTENRPLEPPIGTNYFDTTLGKEVIWNGTKWVDATGADV